MGKKEPVTTTIVDSNARATSLSTPCDSIDGEKILTETDSQNEKSRDSVSAHVTVAVAPEDNEGDHEGPLTSFFRVLYEFSTPYDHVLRIVGLCAAIASGAALPCMTLVFGSSVNEFNSFGSNEQSSSTLYKSVSHNALWFVYLFIARYVLVYIHSTCFGVSGIRATQALRQHFIKAVLRQEIAYVDSRSLGAITTAISSNVDMVENGITEKIGSLIQAISMLIAGFVVAFTQQWKLTLVTATTLPVLFAGFYITFGLDAKIEGKILKVYNSASGLAEEAMSSMRMVTALDIGKRLGQKYDIPLAEAERLGLTKGPVIGFQYSVEMFTTYCAYALAWYYGTKLLKEGEIGSGGGGMITVLLSVLLATQAASDVAPGFSGFTRASASAKEIFKVVDRRSKIDPLGEEGHKPEVLEESKVELRDVTFAYPSRPTLPILRDFSITFEAGKTTALVGSSGSGKSTIVGLIERWFDTESGSVLVGGHPVTNLNVRWLRNQVGLVQQEPVLFSDSIYNNVAHGLYGTSMDSLPEVKKRELVRQACIQAFADDFIQDLPDKYDTLVGERGRLLSGGQKQRIAIARVVISDPRILLLDEATSALDPTAEKKVQAALDNVSKSRTTIMIAHKLSTVQKADKIVVLSHGKVVEQGTHQELLAAKGSYHKLVSLQNLDTNNEAIHSSKDSQNDECSIVDNSQGYHVELPELPSSRLSSTSGEDTVVMPQVDAKASEDKKEEYSEDDDLTEKLSLVRCIAIIICKEQRHIWFLFLAGLLSSAGSGGAFPAQAVLFGKSISTLQLPHDQHLTDRGSFWALMYFVLGLAVFVANWGVGNWWTVGSFRATRQYRREYFEAMMNQDVAFFDLKGHSAAEMTTRLSTHPLHLQLLLSTNLALIVLVIFNVLGCCILSLVIGWKLALPVMALGVPLLFGAGYFRMRMEMSNQDRVTAIYQEAARFASEAVGAIRTVSSLALEQKVLDGYERRLDDSAKLEMRHKLLSMLLFAFSESISLAVSAFSFWYGGKLLSENEYSVSTFFIVFIAISMGMQTAGFMFGFTSDLSKAHKSANHIIDLRRSKPAINNSTGSHQALMSESKTAIEFKNVTFLYPNRPDIPVLRDISFKIDKGQSVGIVGASGCGKSTIIALLERFYDAEMGQVLIGDVPMQQLNVQEHRSRLGLVSQDTILYQGSIRENILLGRLPGQATTSEDESKSEAEADEAVIRACKLAQIDEFIMSLPEGYHTKLGGHGISLSGGQRQRLAIARALIREPDILLFDEATSALDTESEALVQKAFEAITQNNDTRTVISVAHRLSTIKQCDRIFVLYRGEVVEEGTHDELVAHCGRYHEMVLAQTLDAEAS
ncbi:uncharacterized protein N7483_010735 [Penicillium malachiteum]|uniref:uncharacterized protein n=1 Tax=Penicillium malachiteum TaxID=1324776 RepID=UPI002548F0E4|nr:uncharacterized protein N7483_010735 [Penicillium malachiteum]KAJ5713554.1 hypothetical protein N7483_010735 [Penicillium malachiteum]